MDLRHEDQSKRVDFKEVWGSLLCHSRDELQALTVQYELRDAPLGRGTWEFALWVLFETWSTKN